MEVLVFLVLLALAGELVHQGRKLARLQREVERWRREIGAPREDA